MRKHPLLALAAAVLAVVLVGLYVASQSKDAIPRFSPSVQEFKLLGDSRPQDAGKYEAELRQADYEPIGYESTEIGGTVYEGTLWRTTDQGRTHANRSAMFLMKDGRPIAMVGTWEGDMRCAIPADYLWRGIETASSHYRMFNVHDVKSVFPVNQSLTIGGSGTFSFTCDR